MIKRKLPPYESDGKVIKVSTFKELQDNSILKAWILVLVMLGLGIIVPLMVMK